MRSVHPFRWSSGLALSVGFLLVGIGPGTGYAHQPAEVDLQLVLAADVSGSMDLDELALQQLGYVSAFRDPGLLGVISSGPLGRIAVTYVEWAGSAQHWTVVPWTIISDRDSADAFARRLAAAPLNSGGETSMALGLLFAADQFDTGTILAERMTIDISGDGTSDVGPPITSARDFVVAKSITINGLPVSIPHREDGQLAHIGPSPDDGPDIDTYYRKCVIGGTDAFAMPVSEPSQFLSAIRQKLILEIAERRGRVIPAAFAATAAPAIDCQLPDLPPDAS